MVLPLKKDARFGLLCVACVPGGGLGHIAVIIGDADIPLSLTMNLISVVAMLGKWGFSFLDAPPPSILAEIRECSYTVWKDLTVVEMVCDDGGDGDNGGGCAKRGISPLCGKINSALRVAVREPQYWHEHLSAFLWKVIDIHVWVFEERKKKSPF